MYLQARLRLAEVVEKEDVNEAMRLMEMSKDSLNPSVEHGRFVLIRCYLLPLHSARQHPSYGDCLEVKMEYYQNCSVLDCVTLCSQSAAHLYEQFLQVKQIGFVTLGPLRCV